MLNTTLFHPVVRQVQDGRVEPPVAMPWSFKCSLYYKSPKYTYVEQLMKNNSQEDYFLVHFVVVKQAIIRRNSGIDLYIRSESLSFGTPLGNSIVQSCTSKSQLNH